MDENNIIFYCVITIFINLRENKSTNPYMLKQEPKVQATEKEPRRFSIRQWEAQNATNKSKGRPAIKLEEHEADLVRGIIY